MIFKLSVSVEVAKQSIFPLKDVDLCDRISLVLTVFQVEKFDTFAVRQDNQAALITSQND